MLNYTFYPKKTILFFLLLVLTKSFLVGQNPVNKSSDAITIRDSIGRVYGMDPLLYNGMLYKHFYPANVKGDQFLVSSSYQKGDARIRGIKYKNLDLNYDIYNQEVLLKFLNSSNVYSTIMISKAWLEDFSIGPFRFVYLNIPGLPRNFYQVLGSNSILLLYYWKKDLKIDNIIGNTSYYFVPKREQNILINNTLFKFYNSRSFIHLFPKEKQDQIKKYLRKNKIKIKKAPDYTMEELINYCSKL